MQENQITNEDKNDYYSNQIRNLENEIFDAKNKLSRLQIRLNDLKRQQNLHTESAQRRIAELFVRGS